MLKRLQKFIPFLFILAMALTIGSQGTVYAKASDGTPNLTLAETPESKLIRCPQLSGTWNRAHFGLWYFCGGGETVDLSQVGLLRRFQNSPDVRRKTSEFSTIVEQIMRDEASELKCGETRTLRDFPDGWPGSPSGNRGIDVKKDIYAVGKTSFFREYQCTLSATSCSNGKPDHYNYMCYINYSIKDWFKDPINRGFELPGGTPYPINASWTVTLTNQEKIRYIARHGSLARHP